MSNKRGRDNIEDDDVSTAAMELGATLGRGLEMKLRALNRLRGLIDRHDDLYINQRALADADCAFHLVELLQDESDAVAVRSARVIASMTDHSAPAKAKLQNGPLIGLESSVAKVMLNPVQEDFLQAGAIPLLVGWLPLPVPQKNEVALQALTNLSSYNHEGKVAYLEALVDVVASGKYHCLEHLDDLIDGLHSTFSGGSSSSSGDDSILQLCEKVSQSVIQAAKLPGQVGEKAVAVLGTLCEHVPELAKELRTTTAGGCSESGIVSLVAKHLLLGSIQAQDTAARTLWYLTLGDENIFGPDGPLASQVEAIASVLRALVERSAKDEEEEDARIDLRRNSVDYHDSNKDGGEDDRGEVGGGSYHSRRSSYGGGGVDGFGPGLAAAAAVIEEVCFAEEAQRLLKAVIACNPELRIESGDISDKGASCCMM
ncbi:hypothetical protein Ndes2526B_g03485 [Nannochloris sp. 'desiccata']|nr:hypothetical protein KSW81_001186 [Chlorella desiccata (nom. nud.)]KAH7622652.1 hypothetical protein NADE_005234 [Chlorella desiccata (nom. nud.)]